MSTPVLSPEPQAPPSPANLPDVRELMQKLVDEVAEESRARTTRYQQGQQWDFFVEWCDARGFPSLPADPETVALFIPTLLGTHSDTMDLDLGLALAILDEQPGPARTNSGLSRWPTTSSCCGSRPGSTRCIWGEIDIGFVPSCVGRRDEAGGPPWSCRRG